jgi:hypothetical protein
VIFFFKFWLSFSIQKLFDLFILAYNCHWAEFFFFFFFFFFYDFRPRNASAHQKDSETAYPCVKPRRLSHRARLCDAQFAGTLILLIKSRKEYFKKKLWGLYISDKRVGTPIQLVAMGVYTSVKVPNVMKRASLGGLICKRPILGFSEQKAAMALTMVHCATVQASDYTLIYCGNDCILFSCYNLVLFEIQ